MSHIGNKHQAMIGKKLLLVNVIKNKRKQAIQKINTMKTLIYTFILIIATATTSFAKTDYYPGKVVDNAGQAIEGKIGVVSPTYNEIKVKFIATNGKKKTYKVADLEGYSFEVPVFNRKTKKYEAKTVSFERKTAEDAVVDFGSKELFVEKAVDGNIEVFNHYAEGSDRMSQKLVHTFYVEKDGQIGFTKLTRKNYSAIMQDLTADMPELSKLVGTPGHGYKYIAKMAKTYNDTKGLRQPVSTPQPLDIVNAN